VCQRIIKALLAPRSEKTVRQLILETGVPGGEILPVINKMLVAGSLVVTDGWHLARITMLRLPVAERGMY
jgi:hypothetical protein